MLHIPLKNFFEEKHSAEYDDGTRLNLEYERELCERRLPSEDDYETIRVGRNDFIQSQCLVDTGGLKVIRFTGKYKFVVLSEE